jgi:hypothetical protein
VLELKLKTHWRKFVADCDDNAVFKAYRYTKPSNCNNIALLLDDNNNLTSNKEEQARLPFNGTSDVPVNIDTRDFSPHFFTPPFHFPPITPLEISCIVDYLPKKKACGHDNVPNKLIKWGYPVLQDILTRLFNSCLNHGYFPSFWKHAITAIIQKANEELYAMPNAYRPIALLSCLGKLFESIITKHVTFWAENNQVLAEGHFGGRAGRGTDNANLFLTSWICQKWREKKTVSALFLDVKSAFPSVVKERLIDTLQKKKAPPYLSAIISDLLSNRTTSLKMEDYTSPHFI